MWFSNVPPTQTLSSCKTVTLTKVRTNTVHTYYKCNSNIDYCSTFYFSNEYLNSLGGINMSEPIKMVTKTVTYYDNISHRTISVVVTVPEV